MSDCTVGTVVGGRARGTVIGRTNGRRRRRRRKGPEIADQRDEEADRKEAEAERMQKSRREGGQGKPFGKKMEVGGRRRGKESEWNWGRKPKHQKRRSIDRKKRRAWRGWGGSDQMMIRITDDGMYVMFIRYNGQRNVCICQEKCQDGGKQ